MRKPFDGNFAVTCDFNQHLENGGVQAIYPGTDFACPKGTLIYACEAGYAFMANDHLGGNQGGANYVYLYSGNKTYTYVHLDRFNGKTRNVSEGELLGYTGDSGQVTGPHLHFGYMVDGVWKDPQTILNTNYYPVNMNTTGYEQEVYGPEVYYAIPNDGPSRIVQNFGLRDSAQNMNYLAQLNGYSDFDDMRVHINAGDKVITGLHPKPQPEVITQNPDLAKLKQDYETKISDLQVQLQDQIHKNELDVGSLSATNESLKKQLKELTSLAKNVKIENIVNVVTKLHFFELIRQFLKEQINRWGDYVDRNTTNDLVRGFLKYNIFVIIFGGGIYLVAHVPIYLGTVEWSPQVEFVITGISTILGNIFKDMLPSYDTNGDGVLNSADFI